MFFVPHKLVRNLMCLIVGRLYLGLIKSRIGSSKDTCNLDYMALCVGDKRFGEGSSEEKWPGKNESGTVHRLQLFVWATLFSVLTGTMPWRRVPEHCVSQTKSLRRSVPQKMRPSDNASLGRCGPRILRLLYMASLTDVSWTAPRYMSRQVVILGYFRWHYLRDVS